MVSEPFAQSLSRRPLPDVIAERITSAIVNRTLKPGDRLPSEPELARQMGVGRTSLREAIGKLQSMGAVEVVRGRGTYIRQPPKDHPKLQFSYWSTREGIAVAELLEMRIGLEMTAASLACIRASAGDLANFKQKCVDHEEAHFKGDLELMVHTDEAVHAALLQCSHNAAISQVCESLVPSFEEFRRRTLSLEGVERRSTQDHFEIYDAVADRDASAARRAVVSHLWALYCDVMSAADPDRATGSPYGGYEAVIDT